MNYIICQSTGKIILSGEYAVVFGYPGVAIPAPFGVTVAWTDGPSPQPLSHWEREMNIEGVIIQCSGIESEEYLHRVLDAITAKTGPLHGHLTMRNTIPIGRGMGSSTALVIALCRCLLEKFPPPKGEGTGEGYIKEIALSIENTVNPGHSGLDFAVIWEGKPVKFTKDDGPTPIDLDLSFLKDALLIDTGKPNETTAEMIAWVKEQVGIPSPLGGGPGRGDRKGRGIAALQTIAHCTERLIAGESPFTVFPDHHRAQVALGVVPAPVQALIVDIEKAGGAAKVVGAGARTGGGGMVLALHKNKDILKKIEGTYGFSTLLNPKA